MVDLGDAVQLSLEEGADYNTRSLRFSNNGRRPITKMAMVLPGAEAVPQVVITEEEEPPIAGTIVVAIDLRRVQTQRGHHNLLTRLSTYLKTT